MDVGSMSRLLPSKTAERLALMELSNAEKNKILERDGHQCKGCENANCNLVVRLGEWSGPIVPLWEWKCICTDCHENNLSQSFLNLDVDFDNPFLNLDIDFDNPESKRRFKQYYKSDNWIRKRDRVLHRDNGICQHCLDKHADQVHHFTYDHFKHEFLFELSSICSACHCREHGIGEGSQRKSGVSITFELEFDDDEDDIFCDPDSKPIRIPKLNTVKKSLVIDLSNDSPMEAFKKYFWLSERDKGPSIARSVMSVFACECDQKCFGYIQGEKKKEYCVQCARCGHLVKSSLAKNKSKQKPIELDEFIEDDFIQEIADRKSARRRGTSWIESVECGEFWPCDCKDIVTCVKVYGDRTWDRGNQCKGCGGFVLLEQHDLAFCGDGPLYDESLSWNYRFAGIYSEVSRLEDSARKEAEDRLRKMLESESRRLKIEEGKWKRLTERRKHREFELVADRVLKRDKSICQACLLATAQDVYQFHRYSRIPLDCTSIISICNSCLERIDLADS